ncbi:MAG: carbon-nitrogen hydrolase family protein [Gammaproteobacteria bacterium]|nr:MAG: carbon-nitrogen hydrolase family protein [Gammaproteobacteria bacterium]
MPHFSIAALQLSLPAEDNLERIGDEIINTKKRFPWINMVVLSELCCYGPDKRNAQQLPSSAELFFCRLAKEQQLWIITGSQFELVGNETYNTSTVINNQGEILNRYRKIYPFHPYESGVSPGKDFVVFDVPQGRIGLAICYDLWFPEVARTLTCMGAEVIIYPTMTGTIDRPLETLLTQSTSITNQCYTLSVNTAGIYGNGQSTLVGPQGDLIYQAGSGQEIIPFEVDFNLVRRSRERGLHGLGQPLKSFRDNAIKYSIYKNDAHKNAELNKLGSLVIPHKEQG